MCMKQILILILSFFIVSCTSNSTMDEFKGHIKQVSFSKETKYPDGSANTEKHTEFFLKKENMVSKVGLGVVLDKNNKMSIYTCPYTKRNSYYLENKEQLNLLEYILDYYSSKSREYRLANIELSVKDIGLAGLSISNEYKQKLQINNDCILSRSNDIDFITKNAFYLGVLDLLHDKGYDVEDIEKTTFIPLVPQNL